MARIFLSYHHLDRTKARAVEKGLAEKGHHSVWGVDELIAGRGGGELMPTRPPNADKLRALLPGILGLSEAPAYARDILALRGPKSEDDNLSALVGEIDRAIQAHLTALENEAERVAAPKLLA